MYDFLPDSHRSFGSLDMFGLCDRPRIAAPRPEGTTFGRARTAFTRFARSLSAAPVPATPPYPVAPVIIPF